MLKRSALVGSFFIVLVVSSASIVLGLVGSAPQSTTRQTNIPANRPLSGSPSPSSIQPNSITAGLYWFQVGVWAANGRNFGNQFGIPVTGASVEIRINYKNSFPQGSCGSFTCAVSYWVGINLPGDSFIQVGYGITATDGYPQWFWEYFLPGTANENTGGVLGKWGDEIGPNGTWYHFSLQSSGTRWYAFVNGAQVGSVDLGVSSSGSNGPSAVAEVPGVRNANTLLGPVEFRNLQYRDVSSSWHMVSGAVSLCCFGSSSYSDTYQSSYPYGVEVLVGQNNEWIAGSNLPSPIREEGDYLWPWYHVTIQDTQGEVRSTAWYVYGSTIDLSDTPSMIQVSSNTRYQLENWYVNGQVSSWTTADLTVGSTTDLNLKPMYMKQYLVQVNSQIGTPIGSGWYDEGTSETIRVTLSSFPASGILAYFGVETYLSGWTGGYNGSATNGEAVVKVNGPMAVNAIWRTSYGVLPYCCLLTISAIAITLWFILRRRK